MATATETFQAFFVRHTNRHAVGPDTIDRLFHEDRIAVHFPGSGAEDSRSVDPADYTKKNDRKVIGRLAELAANGGYVWAQYHTQRDCKIGFVEPGEPDLIESTWENPRYAKHQGRKAILKTLRMGRVKLVRPGQLMSLRVARPRQGTISRWPSGKKRLRAAVEGEPLPPAWSNLSAREQETVCAEFLRVHDESALPRLKFLLLPPGGTMQAIDVYGLAEDGKKLYAQVTFQGPNRKKVKALREHAGEDVHLVFFCKCSELEREDGITFVPWSLVEAWLLGHAAYADRFTEVI